MTSQKQSLRTLSLWIVALIGAAASCEHRQNANAPQTQPTTAAESASSTHPATSQALTQPVASLLEIDQKPVEFPPARLRISSEHGQLEAILFTDDPAKNEIETDYSGNSYYFKIPLQSKDVRKIVGEQFRYKAPASQPVKSPRGIFLTGFKTHLQPQDVLIRFDGRYPNVIVRIAGQFLIVEETGDGPPPPLQYSSVSGALPVSVQLQD